MTHINNDKNILNDISVFQNTRVPIQNLFDYLVMGDTITHFLEYFPTVTLQQLKQTLKDAELVPKHDIQYDDYEMKDEYDFSDGVRGHFYQPKKIPTSMILDNDILIFFKKQAGEKKIAYQTLINNLLREYMQKDGLDAS